jgi:uncharacterized protein
LIAILALSFTAGFNAFWIEPFRIEVTRHRVSAAIPTPLKIAHLTDIHTYGLGAREQEMIRLIDAERPDLIVITGDLISHSGSYQGCRDVLRKLHAPLGVWIVRGNHEVWWPVEKERDFYASAGAQLIVNENRRIAERVWLIGLDDAFAGAPDLEKGLAGVPPDDFKIALFHSPAFFDLAAGRCDLALAGHTHGGQVRLPLVNPFWLPPSCGRYLEGWYESKGSRMYVSRGIGTSILPIRFMCRPEITIVEVVASS